MRIKVIIGLLILLLGAVWYAYRVNEKLKSTIKPSKIEQEAVKQIQTEATEIAREVRKNGYEHTVYKRVKEIDRSEVDRIEADLLDTIKSLKIARKQLEDVMVITTKLAIQNQKLQKRVDNLTTVYSHSDNYAKMTMNIPHDSTQSATFDFSYNADLVTTDYWKRDWFLGPREAYTDIYSNDPRMTIGGMKRLTITAPKNKVNVDIQASTMFDFGSNSFRVGPGLSVEIGRVKVESKYMMSPSSNRWGFITSGNYNLFSF